VKTATSLWAITRIHALTSAQSVYQLFASIAMKHNEQNAHSSDLSTAAELASAQMIA
jgi:hypothetical protein